MVHKITHAKDPNICFHRFPADAAQRDKRLSMFKLDESEAKPYFALHCRCFPGRNSTRPTSEFKEVFSSPKGIPRDKRVRAREASLLRKPISKPRQGADQLHQLLFCPSHPWPLCHLLHLLAKLCTSLHLFKSCWIATAAPYLQCTPGDQSWCLHRTLGFDTPTEDPSLQRWDFMPFKSIAQCCCWNVTLVQLHPW